MGRKFYLLALVASILGSMGAAADVSWHFSRLFDEFSPPHNVATSGFILSLFLLYWALWRHRDQVTGSERLGLMIQATGLALFLIGIPLDLTWHLIKGIDITTWSPTHLLLFYSSALAQIGLLIAWMSSVSSRAAGAWAITLGFCTVFLSQALFPAYQQEYAAVALASLVKTGHAPWYVAPDMWALAGRQAQRLAHGAAPDWLYITFEPAMGALALTLAAVLVRATVARMGRPAFAWFRAWDGTGGATGTVAIYLAFRVLARAFFGLVGMPVATVAVWLLPLGIALDLALLLAHVTTRLISPARARPGAASEPVGAVLWAWMALGGVAGAAGLYGVMLFLGQAGVSVPAVPGLAVPFALLTGAIGAALGAVLSERILMLLAGAQVAAGSTLNSPTAFAGRMLVGQLNWERAAKWRRAAADRLASWRHG